MRWYTVCGYYTDGSPEDCFVHHVEAYGATDAAKTLGEKLDGTPICIVAVFMGALYDTRL